MASITSWVLSFSVRAPVGQLTIHLAASHTGNIAQRLLESTANLGVEATVIGADDRHVLILAGGNTAAAQDALGVVALQVQGGEVLASSRHSALKAVLLFNAHVVAQLLELAIAAALAGQTFLIVDRQQQLQGHLPGLLDLGGVGEHLHTIVDRIHAGGYQGLGALTSTMHIRQAPIWLTSFR